MPGRQLTLTEFFGNGKAQNYGQQSKRKRHLANSASSPSTCSKKTLRRGISEDGLPSLASNVNQELSSVTRQTDEPTTQQEKGPEKLPLPNAADSSSTDIFESLKEPSWRKLLESEFKKDYIKKINKFLTRQYSERKTIFPPRDLIFNAFNSTPFNDIRVVLIGQDPYHNLSQAHGLCFSVPRGVPLPPSLKNIFKELSSDYSDFKIPIHGSLESWASQGVFLLNATMTVEAHKANSHSHIGWQYFTDAVIKLISEKSINPIVFMLWGGFAHRKETIIDKRKHRVIKAAHPSPLSAQKFFGCKCFSKTNSLLEELGRNPINWTSFDRMDIESNANIVEKLPQDV